MNPYDTLNEILVRMFNQIMNLEQKALISDSFVDITSNDMHIIEAIGIGTPKNMSQIAKAMNVTVGTLTTAMNNLVRKGYAVRTKSQIDRRVVLVSLSEHGRLAYERHAQFHRNMVDTVMNELTSEEIEVLSKSLTKISDFFKNYY